MRDNAPPPPPGGTGQSRGPIAQNDEANILDVTNRFARKSPVTAEELAAVKAFIDGKIEMVRRDTHMTDMEKAAAIAALEADRRNL